MIIRTFAAILAASWLGTAAAQALGPFPSGPVEHVGAGKTDIMHCLRGNEEARQFCKPGWGPAFDQFKKLKMSAPAAYAIELLVPDSTPTPFGAMTASKVIERLRGPLYTKWRVYPDLIFSLDWSQHDDCWAHGILATSLDVTVGGHSLGSVRPDQLGYAFPLTTPTGVRRWSVVEPGSPSSDRVQWREPNATALYAEFDFTEREPRPYPFSTQVMPKVCRIDLSDVQIVLNREATSAAAEKMAAEARHLTDRLNMNVLLFASRVQGADAVKCVLANQLTSLKAAEGISKQKGARDLTARARAALDQSVSLTAGLTQATGDSISYLDAHADEWERACVGASTVDLLSNGAESQDAETRAIAASYQADRLELGELLEDAWSLAVLLRQINTDSRALNWMIDGTLKFRLRTK